MTGCLSLPITSPGDLGVVMKQEANMSDKTVTPIRPGAVGQSTPEMEIHAHLTRTIQDQRSAGYAVHGISFVLFLSNEDGLATSTHWVLDNVDGPVGHALSYASAMLQKEAMRS